MNIKKIGADLFRAEKRYGIDLFNKVYQANKESQANSKFEVDTPESIKAILLKGIVSSNEYRNSFEEFKGCYDRFYNEIGGISSPYAASLESVKEFGPPLKQNTETPDNDGKYSFGKFAS